MPTVDIEQEFKKIVAEVVELREQIRTGRGRDQENIIRIAELKITIQAMQLTQNILLAALNEANAHRADEDDND